MFGGGAGFIAQFVFGKGDQKIILETDKNWELLENKEMDSGERSIPTMDPDPGNAHWKKQTNKTRAQIRMDPPFVHPW